MLQPARLRLGPGGSAGGGETERRPGLHVGAAEEGPASGGPGEGGVVRGHFGARYRFHGQAGGRVPGRAGANLTDGILRLRYRKGLEKEELAVPGEGQRITVDLGVTGNVFRKGHRVRLEVSSSNFPRFDRNPNTGGPIAAETRLVRANQTVYHDFDRPSQLVLPVLP